MNNARHVGRVGALGVALRVGKVRRAATRMTVSVGVAAVVVMATVVPAPDSPASPAVKLSADSTALLLCGATCPTWRDADIEVIMDQFITPTHPGQTIMPVAVTTPSETWPFTGFGRVLGFVTGDPSLFGPGGGAWPDEPWWKLSGLFDLTVDQSVQAGVADLEAAMAVHGDDHLVIYGYSLGAVVANVEKKRLAEQYPAGTEAPDIDFVLGGDLNLPNGGINARFPSLYIPVLDQTFNGPAATDTQFKTVEIIRQYDLADDFPLYPLNFIADLNAVMGFLYVHTRPFDVRLPADPTTSPAYQGTYGDTDYYFFETQDLPLFAPLRQLGVPEPVIDVVEPFFRVLVELGYDRSIRPWEPTPARLIPTTLDPATVTTDLANAIGEGINNAAALVGAPAPLRVQSPVTAEQEATGEQAVAASGTPPRAVVGEVSDGVSRVLTEVKAQLPEPPAVTDDDPAEGPRKLGGELAATRDRITQTVGEVKSVIGDGRTIVRSASGDNRSTGATTGPTHKTPVQHAVTTANGDIKKVVTNVSDSIKKALSGKDDGTDDDGNEGGAQ